MYLKAKDMKYTIGSEDDDYKTKLFLNITLTESADFGAYYCISKNEKGLTKGAVELYGKQTRSIQRMNHHEQGLALWSFLNFQYIKM